MNIGIFTDTYLPDINGVVTSIETLRKALSTLGHEVYIVCPSADISVIQIDEKIIKIPGIEIKKLYGYTVALPIHFELISKIEKLKLDIIHAQTEFGIGILANVVASFLSIPLIWTYHTSYEDYTHYLNKLNIKIMDNFIKDSVSKLSRMYAKNCKCVIVPSKKIYHKLLNYGINIPVHIIPSGIDFDLFKKTDEMKIKEIRKDYKGKIFIYVGRLAKEKAIDELISAFKKVKEEKIEAKLLIVGDGPDYANIQKTITDLKLKQTIELVGSVKYEDVMSYYKASDAFISASLSETQGLTYIEALASGLPIFSKDKELFDGILIEKENGYFFSDAKDLLMKIKDFTNISEVTYEMMSKKAQDKSKSFSNTIFAQKVYDLYENIANDSKESYKISRINLKNDYVVLELYNKQEKTVLNLSLDDYSDNHINKDSLITLSFYQKYKNKENSLLAYQACLKKMASRDYSTYQIEEYLHNNFDLSKEEIEKIIEKLTNILLLDDEKFTKNKINYLKTNYYSSKAIKNKLKSLGIKDTMIDDCLNLERIDELDFAKRKASKYFSSIKNKTNKVKRQMVFNRLIADGFSIDVIKEVIKEFDEINTEENENELLKKEVYKLNKKYSRKYKDKELRNKINKALVLKGFNYDNINEVLKELEEESGD